MTIEIPGYRAGTWTLDPAHSEVTFSVRHMMISKVRGTFGVKSATLTAPENPLEAQRQGERRRRRRWTPATPGATATCCRATSSTRRSTRPWSSSRPARAPRAASCYVDGDLTIHGVTKPVTFELDFGGFGADPYGNYKAGASAKTVINREDFGLTWNAALETGGVLVGKDVTISLDLQGALAA